MGFVGQESHGVHVCNKCGWPFSSSHPSAKRRRAHKRVCGTIEGFKLVESEANTLLTVSDNDGYHNSSSESSLPYTVFFIILLSALSCLFFFAFWAFKALFDCLEV